jgi:hypothetical protein
MNNNFHRLSKKLREIANHFDAESNALKISIIKDMAGNRIPFTGALTSYFETLLFIMALPPDKKTFDLAEREVLRLTKILGKQLENTKELFVNSGIPFTGYRAAFSHDCTRWLLSHPDCKLSIHKIENTTFDLSEVLKVTLPTQERSETTAGFTNEELLNQLMPVKKSQLSYIINELSRLDNLPYIKDHYYDGLGLQTDAIPKNKFLSKAFNRIEIPEVFYHKDLVKHFDIEAMLNKKLPPEAILTEEDKKNLIRVIKNSMAMTERETDPATYLKEDSLRLFHLERGVSIAIYGMPQPRQLPMESYIGYTLFKNGYPAAYAGGWVFGWRSDYGLNIYDQFRGGESAFMVAQVLRLYRQLFQVNYFQVEASQFGLDSPEGIATGVFWFYHKLGFRPLNEQLRQLAKNEYQKIKSHKGYRSSEKTLIKFTEDDIFLKLGKKVQPGVYDITSKIKKMILKKYKGDSQRAEQTCVKDFLAKTIGKDSFTNEEHEVLKEVALWASAMNITDQNKLNSMLQMVKLKPADEYKYQEQLRLFFGDDYNK